MKLRSLSHKPTSTDYFKLYESQFGSRIDVSNIDFKGGNKMLSEIRQNIKEYKGSVKFHRSENNPTYLRMLMLAEALTIRVSELKESAGSFGASNKTKEDNMSIVPGKSDEYSNALKKSASGEDVTTECKKLRKSGVKEGLVKVLENRYTAIKFMRKIVENKRGAKRAIMEGDVENAQVVLAAQDIVDRIQKMIEEMVDVQYKDIPSLADSVKAEMGIESSVQFSETMTTALQTLADQLKDAKSQMESAVGIVTGEEVGMPADMGMEADPMADELDLEGLDDIAPEADMEFDSDVEDLGRERR